MPFATITSSFSFLFACIHEASNTRSLATIDFAKWGRMLIRRGSRRRRPQPSLLLRQRLLHPHPHFLLLFRRYKYHLHPPRNTYVIPLPPWP